ncbi:MAG: SH3 domain-containing protein, partial [Acidimicrobiia bacterium]|nr:SH3 domain-containing protein [Acidimicrobiia bacterium]
DIVIGYGRAGDEVFVGDWDANGTDTFAVRRGNVIHVRNSTSSGPADVVFGYGRAGDEVFVGDWDANGTDTFVARRAGPLPGEPFAHFAPALGETASVVGVAFDDTLDVRAGPGTDFGVIDSRGPLDEVVGTGEGRIRHDLGSIWWRVTFDGTGGWVESRFVAELGGVADETSRVVAILGRIPTAPTMLQLGLLVAQALSSDEPPSTITVTIAPTLGDLGEVTYDVVGLGDDAVFGLRLHVFGQPDAGGTSFSLKSVEATFMCDRGVSSNGLCV